MTSPLSVHLLLRWGDVVLRATRVSPAGRFVLGEGGDWVLPAEALGVPRLELLSVEDGQTVLSRAMRDACVLREGSRERVELGAFSIDVHVTGVERSPWSRSRPGFAPLAHHLASAALHVALLGALGSYPSDPPPGDVDAVDARDRASIITGMLARSESFGPEAALGPHDLGDSDATGSRDDRKTAGGTGAPALTEEGALGNPVADVTRGHVGVMGPHDPKDPRLAREPERPDALFDGLWRRVPMPDPDAPVATWGRQVSEGSDPSSARGPMWGGTIEDALGLGGLGLSGTGEGGGFHAVAIGLGTLGLGEGGGMGSSGTWGVGHGYGACGCGEGDPSGHGRLGGGHTVKAPRVRVGATTVNGRLPPEVIQSVVRSNMGRFRACYEQSLRPQPSLQGRVTTKFAIARDGTVPFAVDAGSDVPDAALIACIGRAFESLSFPRPEGGVATVVYPLILAPE